MFTLENINYIPFLLSLLIYDTASVFIQLSLSSLSRLFQFLNRLFDYYASSHPPVAPEQFPSFSSSPPSSSVSLPAVAAGIRAPRRAVAASAVAAAVAVEHGGGGGLGGGGAAGTWSSDHHSLTRGSTSSSNSSMSEWVVCEAALQLLAVDLQLVGPNQPTADPRSHDKYARTASSTTTSQPSHHLLAPQDVANVFAAIVDDDRVGVGRSEGGGGGAAPIRQGQPRARGLRRFELVEAMLRLGFTLHHLQVEGTNGNGGGSCDGSGSNNGSGIKLTSPSGLWKLGPASAAILRRFFARIRMLFEALEVGPNQKQKQHEGTAHKTAENAYSSAEAATAASATASVNATKDVAEPVAVFNACPAGRLSQRLNVPNLADEWRAQVREWVARGQA
jgi:hypothetical protein